LILEVVGPQIYRTLAAKMTRLQDKENMETTTNLAEIAATLKTTSYELVIWEE
jgi:hypothetical protein